MDVLQLNRLVGCNFLSLFTIFMTATPLKTEPACPDLITLNETSGVITSPNYRKKNPNQNCSWQITASEGKRVVLIIEDMKIKRCDASCSCEYLEIQNGLPSDAALSGRRCDSCHVAFFSIRETLKVLFVSDAVEYRRRGFKATYTQVNYTNETTACASGEFLNESIGSFSSPNFPNHYPQYSRCTWNITVPSGHFIKVSFLDLELDSFHCEATIVITNVASGDRHNPLKLCGGSLPHPVYSAGNSIQVIFTSLTKQYSGFNATYTAIQSRNQPVCPDLITLNETSGVITSPRYPGKYPINQTCNWQITASKGKRVVLIIEDMKIKQCKADCACDYLEIQNGLPSDAALSGRRCENRLVAFFSIRKSLKVVFVSDADTNQRRGFKATYIQVNYTNATTACNSGEFLTGLSGSFSSPNYPNNYTQYSRCTWNITVPIGNIIEVSFLNFALGPYVCGVQRACVVITNANVSSVDRKNPYQLCGRQSRPSPVHSVGNSILVIFTSLRYQYPGFNATYRAINNNLDTLTSSEVKESRPVSTQQETTIGKESTAITTSSALKRRTITTQLTPTTETRVAATTATTSRTVRIAASLAPSTTSEVAINTVLMSSMPTTAITNIKETSTVSLTSSVAYKSNNNTPTQEKQVKTTQLTSTKATASTSAKTTAKTTVSSTSTTSRTNKREASTVTFKSADTNASNKNTPIQELFLQYVMVMKALNASNEDSLQDGANITNNFLKELKKRQPENIDFNLLLATRELESFALNFGKIHFKANESKFISQELFAIKVQKVSANNKKAVTFSVNETDYSAEEGRAIISLPPGIFKGHETVIVNIIYSGITRWIPLEENIELDGKTLTDLELGSRIIASAVDPGPSGILQENVTILFIYNKEVGKEAIPHCVFWDFTIKSKWNGSWSSKGCSLVKNVNKEITCTCNHLTNFAVLMQVGANEVSLDHKMALEVITYIGCALSLIGEVLSIIAYCVLMNLKETQIQIHFNLVVAIAIAQITFLAGIDASETEGVCVFVAALIHYFYLAGFAWMLFEGIYLYLMVVKVYNTVVRVRLFYAVAWGVSLLIVVLSIVIASSQDGGVQSYVHGDFCWVSFTNNLIWTFVTPVLVVCLINSVILGLVIHEILKMQALQTSELERVRQCVKACVVLFPLLGMTWVFGVLSFTYAGVAFQYIFTILNSLQGLFIFILHVLRNGDVRAAYSRKKQQWKQSNSIGTSYAAKQNSLDMSLKVIKEKEELRNQRNSATPGSSVGCGCTIALQQKRSITPVDTGLSRDQMGIKQTEMSFSGFTDQPIQRNER